MSHKAPHIPYESVLLFFGLHLFVISLLCCSSSRNDTHPIPQDGRN